MSEELPYLTKPATPEQAELAKQIAARYLPGWCVKAEGREAPCDIDGNVYVKVGVEMCVGVGWPDGADESAVEKSIIAGLEDFRWFIIQEAEKLKELQTAAC